jgi:hypothetical protein
MQALKQYGKHMLQPLNTVPKLNTQSRQDVLASVEQLQMWAGDDTQLMGLSIDELLIQEYHDRIIKRPNNSIVNPNISGEYSHATKLIFTSTDANT